MSSNQQVWSLAFAPDPESGALQESLKAIFEDNILFPIVFFRKPTIGIVIPVAPDEADWVEQAATILRRCSDCKGIVVVHSRPDGLCEGLRASLKASFLEGIRFTTWDGKLLNNLLDANAGFRNRPPSRAAMERIREIIYAKELYQRIEMFSHGGTKDIVNQVVAPLRLLQQVGNVSVDNAWKNAASKVVMEFNDMVLGVESFNASVGNWHLASDLKAVFNLLQQAWPWNETKQSCSNYVHHLDRFMDLLTECRVLAGVKSQGENNNSKAVPPLPAITNQKNPYRVLVVDDHAEAWLPVFKALQKHKQNNPHLAKILRSVQFDFSTDGENLQSERKSIRIYEAIPEYDLILLDVFLNRRVNGMEILSRIRKHSVNIPIVIWTTSRELELPAKALLIHGFLFKKSTDLNKMAELLADRIEEGHAKRIYALPGHFFDHSIRNETNRKCALKFTDYCSKQLDSFHALDDQFFRYFTDHGGRHLFKLLEYLGNVLRPLVDNKKVFSEAPVEHEKEILSLYLAVFLHEFGMFRLKGKIGCKEPDWDRLAKSPKSRKVLKKELALVRCFHAIRGMVMLSDRGRHHWPDEEGQYQAKKRFFNDEAGNYVYSAVALITGYHSRLLLLDEKQFCKWDKKTELALADKAAKALGKKNPKDADRKIALRLISKRFYGPGQLSKTFTKLVRNVGRGRLDRVRKHCAIFRFVDAIDVDYTRNPADFLCLSRRVSSKDRLETLKRQVVSEIKTEGGSVHITVCVPVPSAKALKPILGENCPDVETGLIWKDSSDLEKVKQRTNCQKDLDRWLAKFWNKPENAKLPGVLRRGRNGKFDYRSKVNIASLTALSVAWEILDEYEAIVKCELDSVVKLGNFTWRKKAEEHPPKKLKNMLTMLFHKDGLDRLCPKP